MSTKGLWLRRRCIVAWAALLPTDYREAIQFYSLMDHAMHDARGNVVAWRCHDLNDSSITLSISQGKRYVNPNDSRSNR